MSHAADVHARAAAQEETPSDLRRAAWLGPAIGASILTIAWALYLVPVLFGIIFGR
jgi:hypothetical protein